jgi:hypothetical protein
MGAQHWQLDLIEAGATGVTSSVVAALTDANGSFPALYVNCNASGRYVVTHANGVTGVASTATSTPPWGSWVRLIVRLNADGSVQIGQSVNGGAIVYGTASGPLAFGAQWGASPATAGFYLQPLSNFVKARTRLLEWRVNGAIVSDARLAQLW